MQHRVSRKLAAFALAAASLLALCTSAVPAADRRDFYVYNKGEEPIYYLRVSHISEDKWGDDILGTDVLEPDDRIKVTFSDGEDLCYYDIQVQYKDGDKREKRDVNLCETESVEFYH
jgi:hypothetical protein